MSYKPQMSDLVPVKAPVDPNNPNYYLDKLEFNKALKEYKTQCLAAEAEYEIARKQAEAAGSKLPDLADFIPGVSNYIGSCIIAIAKGVAKKHNFRNYSFIKEMEGGAILTCLRYIRSYDPDRLTSDGQPTSALSYFTQTCHFSFIERIAKEDKQTKIKRALIMSADLDTYSLGSDDDAEEFRMNLTEFISSLGPDEVLDAKIKKTNKEVEDKKIDDSFLD
jgi:hypothetical protein